MATLRFTRDHEWIRVEDDVGIVGITDYAQQQLGDIVFVELPEVGARFKQGEEAAVVESVKAASEVYAPVGGEVVAVNGAVVDDPGRVNASPQTDGWFFSLRLADSAELDALLEPGAYKDYCAGLE